MSICCPLCHIHILPSPADHYASLDCYTVTVLRLPLRYATRPPIDQFNKSQNTPVPYPIMLHSEQKSAHFCSEWSIMGYGTGAFWDFLIRSIGWCCQMYDYLIQIYKYGGLLTCTELWVSSNALWAHMTGGNFHHFRPLTVFLHSPNRKQIHAISVVQGDCERVYEKPLVSDMALMSQRLQGLPGNELSSARLHNWIRRIPVIHFDDRQITLLHLFWEGCHLELWIVAVKTAAVNWTIWFKGWSIK